MPRKDLPCHARRVEIKPGLALRFVAHSTGKRQRNGSHGRSVLTEDEVEACDDEAAGRRDPRSAVHNHLIGESPHVMYMHVASHGDAVQMGKSFTMRWHLRRLRARTPHPLPRRRQQRTSVLIRKSEQILVALREGQGGILQIGGQDRRRYQTRAWRSAIDGRSDGPELSTQQAMARRRSRRFCAIEAKSTR